MSQPYRSLGLAVGLAALSIAPPAFGQQPTPPAPPAPLINVPENPLLHGFRWRSIGPVGQGVRVDDFAVDEKNPTTYYVGFAVSGVVKTVNNGTTFEPIFDTYGSASIADIALAPSDPNILYVATGEANNRQTTSYGDGLYKSTDAGKTFTNIGFKDAQTLGRVIVHPRDPNTVWIAVGGHLYGPSTERGVYMTTDGGKTWTKTLYVDDHTSATELAIDPSNPQNLWAAMYQRERTAWGFNGGGKGSGLYQSTDGGKSWKKVTAPGLPRGTMGRIALDICKTQPNVIYAQIEVAPDKEPQTAATVALASADSAAGGGRGGRGGGGGGGGGGRGGPPQPPNPQSSGVWRSTDKGRTWTFMSNENQRPMYFSQIRVDPEQPGRRLPRRRRSDQVGRRRPTWKGLNNMGHVDNHAIWIDPLNSKHVMYGNDGGIDVTYDAGAKWEAVRMVSTGLAYHASADMRHPYYVCTGLQDNGSWCGPSSVRTNGGIRQWMWISVGGGDGFQNQIDPTDYNIFYTESQNAGIQRYDLTTGDARSIKPNLGGGRGGRGGGGGWRRGARCRRRSACGAGDGPREHHQPAARRDDSVQLELAHPSVAAQSEHDLPRRPVALHLARSRQYLDDDEGARQGDRPQRSTDHGRAVLAAGLRTRRRCRAWPCILSKNDGYVANEFGTMTEMAESPVVPGILWAGTDDGNVQVSRDGGYTWEEVGKNIPGVNHEYYVSGLEASHYDAGTAYLALDGHRNNDLKPYIFKTTDYGKTWTSVSGNLPAVGNVNSIRQDPVNRNLLYAPTELGFYISLDDGKNWHRFMPNLPIGRTDEVLVHPRENDLILATHSRSVWIMDDVASLQHLTQDVLDKQSALLPTRDAVLWKNDRRLSTAVPGDKWWAGESAPRGTAITYYLKSGSGDAKITISDAVTGKEFRTQNVTSATGLNRWQWDLCSTAPPQPRWPVRAAAGGGGGGGGGGCQGGARLAPVGSYRVSVSVGGLEVGSQVFKVLEDIWLNER